MKKQLYWILAFVLLVCFLPQFILPARAAEVDEITNLHFDDRVDLSGRTVEIIDAGDPVSWQVGYGIEENTVRDTAVVTLEGDTLVATGIGTAVVSVDGELVEVKVTAAPISLLLLIGQSNMQGSEGNANQSIVCPDGMVYATYGDRYTMTTANATDFVPSALTGIGSERNVNGTKSSLEDWPVYLLNEKGAGKEGPDSGYAYEWVKQTGEKVWVVNAAHGGSSITTWQKGSENYEECILLFQACQKTLQKEIQAGHYTLSHMGYFWCQGCTDEMETAQWYVEKFLSMHQDLKSQLSVDMDGDGQVESLEFADITVPMAGHAKKYGYRYQDGFYDTIDISSYYATFKELEMRGQRVAQYWLAANPDHPEINIVCNIGESWVEMPDGTNGVAAYFAANYKDGTVDYTTQVKQKASWYKPTTPRAVKDSIHYNQIGYNEVGRIAARNALILLGEIPDTDEETTVRLVDWTGFREVSAVKASMYGNSDTLAVPIVSPCYRAKEISFQLMEGLNYLYCDLLAESLDTVGTLTCADKTVRVEKVDASILYEAHLVELPAEICAQKNLWSVLEHDPMYYRGTSGWGVHSSGKVYSVTVPIKPGDKIYASSFGPKGQNGANINNGIRVTWFGAAGVLQSLTSAQTYREFTANGYLTAPEGAVAVNIPMWNNQDDNELYILNAAHIYTNGVCSVCSGIDPDYVELEIITQPQSVGVPQGKSAKTAVEAVGNGLSYEWYYKNADTAKFRKTTSFTGNTYSVKMNEERADRQVYCVITDKYGNSVTSDIATLSMCRVVKIDKQPQSVTVANGVKAVVTLTATGDGLTYEWYYKNADTAKFRKTTSFTGNTYSVKMNEERADRQVYCVITDKYGNFVTSDIATLSMCRVVKIDKQPQSVTVANGVKAVVTLTATGDGLTYEWYYKNGDVAKFRKTTSFTGNTYSVKMNEERADRQVYCVITDKYGNSVKSDTVTLKMK